MTDYFKAPQFAARFREEDEDFNRMQQVPREAMDNEYNRVLRGADAGHLSKDSRRAQANERNAIWGLRDQANQMTSKANAFKRNLSDRDLQWQNMQQDREWKQKIMERQMAQEEDATRYARERDTKQDERADRNIRIQAALAKMNSQDEEERVIGEMEYRAAIGGGGGAAPAATGVARTQAPAPSGGVGRSFVQTARSELVGPLEGPPDEAAYRDYGDAAGVPSAAPVQSSDPYQQRLDDIRERKKKAMEWAEDDRREKKMERSYEFEQKKANNATAAQQKAIAFKMKSIEMALSDPDLSPQERADLMNQAARLQSALPELVNKPSRMLGVGTAVGDAMQNAWDTVDKSGQEAAAGTFKVNALRQKRWEAEQRKGEAAIGREQGFEDVGEAQKVLKSDPQIANAVAGLNRELKSSGDLSWQTDLLNGLDSMLPESIFGDVIKGRSAIGGDKVDAFASKIDNLAKSVASRYPGISSESLRQAILTQLSETLESDAFDPTRRQQFSERLMAPTQRVVAPADAAKYPGATVNRFARRE